MRFITACAAALLLAGCVDTNNKLATGSVTRGESSPRPKTVVVSDFVVAPEVLLIDRGYTARLERKIGAFPTHERKPRTMDRVNDEIVASIVATLREAGLDAQPGAEEGLSAASNAVVVSGRLRPSDANAKKNEAGLVGGKSSVTADMRVAALSRFGKRELLTFPAETNAKLPSGKAAIASNAEITNALSGMESAKEKLSPDVEAAARKLGRSAGEKIVAYAKTQGWLNKPEEAEVVASVGPAKPEAAKPEAAKPAVLEPADDDAAAEGPADGETEMVKLPAAKPKRKPAA